MPMNNSAAEPIVTEPALLNDRVNITSEPSASQGVNSSTPLLQRGAIGRGAARGALAQGPAVHFMD